MNKAKLKAAIKKVEKDIDYRIEFYNGNVLAGLIWGGNELDFEYHIEPKLDKTYCIYFGFMQNVAIVFDRFELYSV